MNAMETSDLQASVQMWNKRVKEAKEWFFFLS